MIFQTFKMSPLCRTAKHLGLVCVAGITVTCMGCGGGGGSSNVITPPSKVPNTVHGCANAFVTTVSGKVTNLAGAPIVGATVSVGTQTAVTTQFGTYTIASVNVSASSSSVIMSITASATVQGVNWTGKNTLEISGCDTNTTNTNIVLSPANTQASITGIVSDSKGPLVNARVFAGAVDPSNVAYLNPRSFWAVTDSIGHYTISGLPMTGAGSTSSYTVTASKDLYINKAATVSVNSGQQSTSDFTLAAATTGPCSSNIPCPPVTNFVAIAITTPASATRSAAFSSSVGTDIVKQYILQHRGLHSLHTASSIQKPVTAASSRSAPAGSNIESNLFWDADLTSGLLGYDVLRSDLVATKFRTIAVLRDAQADHFTDVDSALTPNSIYYYSVTKLDTFNFPTDSEEGQPIQNANSVVVPLDPQSLLLPADKSVVSGTPVFTWPSITDGSIYQVLVYDKFPVLQSSVDASGVQPIWPVSSSDASTEIHAAAGTQPAQYTLSYAGPALVSGHTYYWAVLTSDSGGGAYSISQIYSFTAP